MISQKISSIFGGVILVMSYIPIISQYDFLQSTVPEADWSCQEALCLQPTFRERQSPGTSCHRNCHCWKSKFVLTEHLYQQLEPIGTNWNQLEPLWNQLEPIGTTVVPLVASSFLKSVGTCWNISEKVKLVCLWRQRWWRVARSVAPTPTPESEVGRRRNLRLNGNWIGWVGEASPSFFSFETVLTYLCTYYYILNYSTYYRDHIFLLI